MTDKVVALEASDLFAMGANFHEKASSSPATRDAANIMDKSGNVECETMVNGRTEYTNAFDYCNAAPDIKTDLGTHLTTFGDVFDSKIVTQIVITFNAGAYASVDVTGHNHDDNAHATGLLVGRADMAATLAAGLGFGVPDYGVTLGVNATPTQATLTLIMNHIDRVDTDGDHWVGKNITPRAELSMEFEGLPTSLTAAALEADMAGWTIDTNGPSDGNQEFDTFALTAHRHFDLATV